MKFDTWAGSYLAISSPRMGKEYGMTMSQLLID